MDATSLDLAIRLTGSASGALSAIGSVRNSLNSMAGSAARVGTLLSATVTAPALAAFTTFAGRVAGFETNLNLLEATTGATNAEMSGLSALAKQLGADFQLPGTSAADAASAMLEMGRAGVSLTDIMAGSRGVLQLAAAGQLGNARAAEIAANALNAFKLSGADVPRVADLIAAAANSSSASVEQIAFSFSRGSAAFAGAKIPIDQFATSIAALANAGVKGEDAGTSLKALIAGFANNTKAAIRAQQQLGVAFFDAQGRLKPLPTIIGDLNRGLGRLSQQQQIRVLRDIFGSDAERAARILADLGQTGFEQLNRAVTKQGAAAALASAQNKGLQGALDGLRSMGETLAITVLNPMLPTLSGIVRQITNLVGAVNDLSPNVRNAALAFTGVLAAAGPAALLFSGLASALSFLLTPFGLVTAGLAGLGAWLASDSDRAQRFVASVTDLGQTLLKAFSPETRNGPALVAAAFQRLTGLNVTGLVTGVANAFVFARDAVSTFVGALSGTWADDATGKIDPVHRAIGLIGLFIRDTVLPAMSDLLPIIVDLATGLGTTLLGGAQAVIGFFKGDGVPIFDRFLALGQEIWRVVGLLLGPAFETLTTNAGEIVAAFGPLATSVRNLLVSLEPLAGFVGNVLAALVAALPGFLQMLTGFVNGISSVVDAVMSLLGGLKDAFVALWSGDVQGALDALLRGWEGIKAANEKATSANAQIAAGQAAAALAAQQAMAKALGLTGPQGRLIGPVPNPSNILATAPGAGPNFGKAGGNPFGLTTPEEREARQRNIDSYDRATRAADAFAAKMLRATEIIGYLPSDMATGIARALEI